MGLNDKLTQAPSAKIIEDLLAEGAKYPDASPKTRRRWKSVATRRLKVLTGEVEQRAAEIKVETNAEKPKNKYRKNRPK